MPRWKSTTGICHQQTTGHIEFQVINRKLAKPILSEIDTVLAKHYGFTEAELDFILNYDISPRKLSGQEYHLGRAAGEEE